MNAFLPMELTDSEDEINAKAGPDWIGRRCRRCGASGLHWEETGDGWRLFDGVEIHKCKEAK